MKNVELAPEERSLIAAARGSVGPTEIQRARVRKGLDAKIAAGVAAPVLAASAGLATLLKVGAGIAVAAVIGGGAIHFAVPRLSAPAMSPATPKVRAQQPVRTPTPAVASAPESAPAIETPPAVATGTQTPLRVHGSARRREASPPVPADFAGELSLLTQASAATQRGDTARADELLRTYDQRHPSGQLAQERAATGVLAHCSAGRIQQARSEARRFLERWPRSPLVARIQGSCAVENSGR